MLGNLSVEHLPSFFHARSHSEVQVRVLQLHTCVGLFSESSCRDLHISFECWDVHLICVDKPALFGLEEFIQGEAIESKNVAQLRSNSFMSW